MDWTQIVPLVGCLAAGALYARELRRGRGSRAWRWRAAAFYGGLLSLAAALVWPVDGYADELFSMHMVQHVLLLTVAPPLLVLGRPWLRVWRPLPLAVRRPAARGLARAAVAAPPIGAWVFLNGSLLLWHVPTLYSAAVRHTGVHVVEHLTFFLSGMLFWAIALGAPPLQARLSEGWRIVYLGATLFPGWILALVLAFAHSPLYTAYTDLAARPWGLTALGDQQLAAGVMWVPGSLPYVIAIVVLFYRWLDHSAAPPVRVAARPS